MKFLYPCRGQKWLFLGGTPKRGPASLPQNSGEGKPFPEVLRSEGGAPFRGASEEQPFAATTRHNCGAGEAPFRGDGGSAPHTPSPSTRFGKVVDRRKRGSGGRGRIYGPRVSGEIRFVPDMCIKVSFVSYSLVLFKRNERFFCFKHVYEEVLQRS